MAEIFDPKPVEVQGFEFEERILKLADEAEKEAQRCAAEADEAEAAAKAAQEEADEAAKLAIEKNVRMVIFSNPCNIRKCILGFHTTELCTGQVS